MDDPIHSRTWDISSFRTTKVYFLVKTLVAQALEENKLQKEIIHTIRIFEGKFEGMCQEVFYIKIMVSNAYEEFGKGKKVEGSTSLIGAPSNPIVLDGQPELFKAS